MHMTHLHVYIMEALMVCFIKIKHTDLLETLSNKSLTIFYFNPIQGQISPT